MILIAHRGNIDGPNQQLENTPQYIENAILKGFNVEIDLRYEDGKLRLGHDNGMTNVSLEWLLSLSDKLWIHCKNLNSLKYLYNTELNYFWHQEDDFTLTSHKFIWAYPYKDVTELSVIVCTTEEETIRHKSQQDCYGVCSDYIEKLI